MLISEQNEEVNRESGTPVKFKGPEEQPVVRAKNAHFRLNSKNMRSFNLIEIQMKESNTRTFLEVPLNESDLIKTSVFLPDQSDEMKKKNHEHVVHCAQGLKIFKGQLPPKGVVQLGNNEIIQKDHNDNRKLLIFDMDETLMHTIHHFEDDNVENHKTDKKYDFKLPVNYTSGKTKYICINVRPFVREILRLLKNLYRIVLFTASVPSYADAILDFLDPNKEIFEARYYRGHCFTTKERVHVKDMRIFLQPNSKNDKNWELKDIIIVDNASHSFAYHVSNGYPILPFYDDKEDRELIHLYFYLKELARIDDVRPVISKTFVLEKLLQDRISELIEGIIEYSVQELTDEDMLLFDKYFSSEENQDNKPQEACDEAQEQEQGQLIDENKTAHPDNLSRYEEEIVDIIHVEVDPDDHESYNCNIINFMI